LKLRFRRDVERDAHIYRERKCYYLDYKNV
jgi:hypothetical protein